MTRPLVIVGAGGFGRETLDVALAVNAATPDAAFDVLGVIDAQPSEINLERLRDRDIPYLGTESDWFISRASADFVIAIGSPAVRQRVAAAFQAAGLRAATLVHPSVVIGSQSSIGAGTIVCAGAQISTNVHLGEHVHVNPHATIGHDTVVESFVSINPAAVVSGDVTLGTGTLVGAGAVILQGLSVGAASTVGAAACVVRDVPKGTAVKGIPAR